MNKIYWIKLNIIYPKFSDDILGLIFLDFLGYTKHECLPNGEKLDYSYIYQEIVNIPSEIIPKLISEGRKIDNIKLLRDCDPLYRKKGIEHIKELNEQINDCSDVNEEVSILGKFIEHNNYRTLYINFTPNQHNGLRIYYGIYPFYHQCMERYKKLYCVKTVKLSYQDKNVTHFWLMNVQKANHYASGYAIRYRLYLYLPCFNSKNKYHNFNFGRDTVIGLKPNKHMLVEKGIFVDMVSLKKYNLNLDIAYHHIDQLLQVDDLEKVNNLD